MKPYPTDLSPFPTRVRLMLYAKGIDGESVTPHGFHGDTTPKCEYEEINPMGRVPTLVLEDGTSLPESEVICEYLEDAYPNPALHPSDPADKARRALAEITTALGYLEEFIGKAEKISGSHCLGSYRRPAH